MIRVEMTSQDVLHHRDKASVEMTHLKGVLEPFAKAPPLMK